MKIAFVCKHDWHVTHSRVARHMREAYGVSPVAITYNPRTARILEREGAFDAVHDFPSFMAGRVGAYSDMREVRAAVRDYDRSIDGKLGLAWTQDRTLFPASAGVAYLGTQKYTYDHILKIIRGSIEFWENLSRKEAPDLVLGELGNLNEIVGWHTMGGRGGRYCSLMPARIFAERFFLCDNFESRSEDLDREYESLKTADLSPAEDAWADEFLNDYIECKRKPYYAKSPTPLDLDFGRIWAIIREIRARRSGAASDSGMEFMLEDKDSAGILALGMHRVAKAVRFALSARQFESAPAGEYFYFPLHFQPEISTLAYAPFYDNQVAVVENLCKAIPAGSMLAIKEHPAMRGRRALAYYKAIKRFPNAVLVSQEVDSHNLILNSAGVIVLTGTVGLEAAFYGKPVITLGHAYFNSFDLIWHASGYDELPLLFMKALEEFTPDRGLLKKYLVALKRTTFRGAVVWPLTFMDHEGVGERIKEMASAIVRQAQRTLINPE